MSDNENEKPQKKDAGKIFLEEVSKSPLTVTILAIVTGLLLGGLLVAVTTEEVNHLGKGSRLAPTQLGKPTRRCSMVQSEILAESLLPFGKGTRKRSAGQSTHFSKAWCNLRLTFLPVWHWHWVSV